MKTIVVASTRESSGKTSVIVGMMKNLEGSFGYIKPFGDRLIYRRKRNWDYDSNSIVEIFGIDEEPESVTLGFDHAKLRYIYDEGNIESTIQKMVENAGKNKDFVFVESGRTITCASSISLDPLSLARFTGGSLVLVASGSNDTILDDLTFVKRHMKDSDKLIDGVIINRVHDVEEFEDIYLSEIDKLGINVLGIVPYVDDLSNYTVGYLSEKLYAKVIAGQAGLSNVVKHVFVGAMSTDETVRNPLFNKGRKLLITSGDRDSTILAALEGDTSGIVLTNNIFPRPNIIARASERNIPLLLVTMDTYQVSMQIDRIEALITNNEQWINTLADTVKNHVKTDTILKE